LRVLGFWLTAASKPRRLQASGEQEGPGTGGRQACVRAGLARRLRGGGRARGPRHGQGLGLRVKRV
jgi:hypothetical protein